MKALTIIDPIAQFPELAAVHAALLPGVLTIGKLARRRVADFEDASRAYCVLRDASGEGGGTWPDGKLVIGGKRYRISYNGKVWEGARYREGATPVYNPYKEQA